MTIPHKGVIDEIMVLDSGKSADRKNGVNERGLFSAATRKRTLPNRLSPLLRRAQDRCRVSKSTFCARPAPVSVQVLARATGINDAYSHLDQALAALSLISSSVEVNCAW